MDTYKRFGRLFKRVIFILIIKEKKLIIYFSNRHQSKVPLVSIGTFSILLVYKFSKSGLRFFNFIVLIMILIFHLSANFEIFSL